MTQSSSSPAANRVISLNSLGRDRSPGRRILAECRDQLVNSLFVWLREVAAPVSEELFLLADSTRERLQQTRYLDLRADVEKDWSHLVETFRRDLSAEADRCQNQEAEKDGKREASLEIPDFEGLQLVADDDLSEHIVIREFSAQLSETCDEELYALNRRVAVLLGRDELTESDNPLAPPVVCRALSDACATIGSNAEERLLLLRRLERHLHLALPPIYQQINAYLVERGILPDLKRNYRRSSGSAAKSATSEPDSSSPASMTPASPTTSGLNSSAGILDALQRLAQARVARLPAGLSSDGGNAMPGAMTSGPPGEVLDPESVSRLLFSSLNDLQHAPSCEPGGLIVNQVRLVRESESAQQVGGLEAVTIDIVAMLFDFIFDDAHIPVAVKALISRLQIPVLKVAMLNPGFFADRQHPTRRFLGSVSGVSIRWGSLVDETDPFYCKLAELVERIQADFEDDVEVFGTALAELEAFVDECQVEEDSTALTAANIVILREQDAEAWERAQRAVQAFRASNSPPALIDAFLTEHWVGVLHKIAVREDPNETDWQTAKEAMKDLSWSIEAKKTPDDRLKLIGMLPKLLAQINKGLDSVDASPSQRSDFFDQLVQCHSAALKGETHATPTPEIPPASGAENASPAFSPSEEGDLLVTRSTDNGVEVEEVILVGASPIWRADDREIFRLVSELKRGDWVEFHELEGPDGDVASTNRERLNWISPQRGILLFSNHRSAKAISIAPEALARQIRDGRATIVRDEPIFERALSGALESMNAR